MDLFGIQLEAESVMGRALRRVLLAACCGTLILLGLVTPAAAAVDVASSALAGNGAPTSPWIGWETATLWEPETEYFFR
ncbi:MAG: hypothetical protein ACXWBQ_19845, partial [Usitatibacter sp.]